MSIKEVEMKMKMQTRKLAIAPLLVVMLLVLPTVVAVQALREPEIGEMGYDPSEFSTLYIYLHTAPPINDTICTPKVYVQVTGSRVRRSTTMSHSTSKQS